MATASSASTAARDTDDTSSRESISHRVTRQITEALTHGVRPWVQPWNSATALGLPLRSNGVAYRGINILTLWAAAQANSYRSRYWLTFRQALALGGAVRRGEHGQHIVFYSDGAPVEEGKSDASLPRRAVLRSYVVFCADQICGLPVHYYAPTIAPPDNTDVDLLTRFARVPALIEHGGARAAYNPITDTICLPPRHAFVSTAQYFATYLHELGHWTGHGARLARDLQPRASMSAYAREELVAELCSAFLGAELGLPVDHLEDHASYIDVWLKVLDREPGALMAAAAKAQAAADYLRALLLGAPEAGA